MSNDKIKRVQLPLLAYTGELTNFTKRKHTHTHKFYLKLASGGVGEATLVWFTIQAKQCHLQMNVKVDDKVMCVSAGDMVFVCS